jgi:hypothetical protein
MGEHVGGGCPRCFWCYLAPLLKLLLLEKGKGVSILKTLIRISLSRWNWPIRRIVIYTKWKHTVLSTTYMNTTFAKTHFSRNASYYAFGRRTVENGVGPTSTLVLQLIRESVGGMLPSQYARIVWSPALGVLLHHNIDTCLLSACSTEIKATPPRGNRDLGLAH